MNKQNIQVTHHGNHHNVDVKFNAKTGEVSSISSLNFSNNSVALLKLERKRLSGEFSHTGKTH